MGRHRTQEEKRKLGERLPQDVLPTWEECETTLVGACLLTDSRLWGNGNLLAFGAMRSWFESRQPSWGTSVPSTRR